MGKIIFVDFSQRNKDLRHLKKERKKDKHWDKIEDRIRKNIKEGSQ